jgi:hypothetical protein
VLQDDVAARDRRVRPLQARQEWDSIACAMARLIDEPDDDTATALEEEPA